MNISQTDICNRVLSEANGIPESGFPLECFPAKVQSIILDMVSHENYKVEYIAHLCSPLSLQPSGIVIASISKVEGIATLHSTSSLSEDRD